MRRVHFVGKINREIFSVIAPDITTDEVIITDERIEHIKQRHPEAFEKIEPYIGIALENPDYIIEDNNPNTAVILKMVELGQLRIQIVLRVHTASDPVGYKNSIISGWEISKSRWDNYVNNKKILYKRE